MQLLPEKYVFLCVALLLLAIGFGFCCSQKQPDSKTSVQTAVPSSNALFPYDLTNPSLTINLVSEDLQEVSGIGPADSVGVYVAIADEKGEIFFVDGDGGGRILRRVLFREKGDFEGVEMVGQSLYAVKSDGKIFEINNWKNAPPTVIEHGNFLLKQDDVEGLGYDTKRNALLLACKGNPDSAMVRHIYAFDLKIKVLGEKPVYRIDPKLVNQLVPYAENEKQDFFSPSGIAMHPLTDDIYVISSALKRLVVLDYATGNIKHAIRLDKKILPQPEGIAFDAAGNLHICSEGKKGEGLMLRFDFKSK